LGQDREEVASDVTAIKARETGAKTKEKQINNFRNTDFTRNAHGEDSDQRCEKQECGALCPVGMNTWRSTMDSSLVEH
jgi:hypothetical protein